MNSYTNKHVQRLPCSCIFRKELKRGDSKGEANFRSWKSHKNISLYTIESENSNPRCYSYPPVLSWFNEGNALAKVVAEIGRGAALLTRELRERSVNGLIYTLHYLPTCPSWRWLRGRGFNTTLRLGAIEGRSIGKSAARVKAQDSFGARYISTGPFTANETRGDSHGPRFLSRPS